MRRYATIYASICYSYLIIRGPIYQCGLTLIAAWISNHTPSKVWDEIDYRFPNFNGANVQVWKWISNFNPRCNSSYMLGLKLNHVSKICPRLLTFSGLQRNSDTNHWHNLISCIRFISLEYWQHHFMLDVCLTYVWYLIPEWSLAYFFLLNQNL